MNCPELRWVFSPWSGGATPPPPLDALATERRERARGRKEKGIRSSGPTFKPKPDNTVAESAHGSP